MKKKSIVVIVCIWILLTAFMVVKCTSLSKWQLTYLSFLDGIFFTLSFFVTVGRLTVEKHLEDVDGVIE